MDLSNEHSEVQQERVNEDVPDEVSGEKVLNTSNDELNMDEDHKDHVTGSTSEEVNPEQNTTNNVNKSEEKVDNDGIIVEEEKKTVKTPDKAEDYETERNNTKSENSNDVIENIGPKEHLHDERHASTETEEDTGESLENDPIESTVTEEEKEAVEETEEITENKDDDNVEDLVESKSDKKEEEINDKAEHQWLDILGNGLLRKKVIKAGREDSVRPVAGQEVCIKSEGTLENGNKVDTFEEKRFIMGDGDVITAWDLCVSTMTEGEQCELITAPRFAYGHVGRNDESSAVIPGDSEITYLLELLNIQPGPDINNLTDEERLKIGDEKRERGNELFKREDYSQAVYSYSRALKYLEPSTSEEVVDLQVKCWNNIAASHLKVQEYVAAKTACDSVLNVDPSNVKALFRKGKVLCAQGEFEDAVEILRKANTLEPDNRLVRREYTVAKEKFDEERKKQRSMYQRMVNGLGDNQSKKEFFTWPVILGITGVALGGIIAALFYAKHQI